MKEKRIQMYMEMAEVVAKQSYAIRKQVGCIIVKNDDVVSIGFNGTVSGTDNCCEDRMPDGTLVTKSSVVHAEANAIARAARSGKSTDGGILFVTYSPCVSCASLIKQSGISRVYYGEQYRDTSGIDTLRSLGIQVNKITDNDK